MPLLWSALLDSKRTAEEKCRRRKDGMEIRGGRLWNY